MPWQAAAITTLTREGLGHPGGFDCVLWAESALVDVPPGERAHALRVVAELCAPRGRVVVELAASEGYSQGAFRDDLLNAGLVPDLVVSGWDLRPTTPRSSTAITVLSHR